jgi:WD40 repeat protein
MGSLAIEPDLGHGSAPPAYDLFIVHADADRAWVDGYLKHALGLDPARVITPRDFRLAASTAGEFERGVTSSRFTLLVLSPAFLTNRWVEFAEGISTFFTVEQEQNRLLALTLHPCQAPLRLRFRESLDCTDWTRWDDEAARLRRHLDAPEPVLEAIPCPYPGMVPFRKEDARFFHGRDAEIQNLLTLVRQHHFLAVIGSSGSGKSSLIIAGLFPKLDDPRNFPRGTWRVLSMRPGAAPSEELARVLDGATDDPAGAISRALAAEPPAQRLLLLVDQFEELFSQVKEAPSRDAFIGHLKALRADPRCTVILTLRADFYGDLMNSALWPIDKSQLVEVAALRGESLRQAIIKPAEAVGVYLEERLVDRLLADAADEPGSLPMLQEALVLLWGTMSGRLLTRASYDTIGHDGRSGLAVAMATKADATLAALPPDQQRMARRIFLRLVQFGEGRPDTRRQLAVEDLRAKGDDPLTFNGVLERLVENRLLTPTNDDARGVRFDIAHEMLIVGWPASREWVNVRRNAEKTRRRLAVKAEEWVRLGLGDSGLLDPGELLEAEDWLSSPDATDLGIDANVQALAVASRAAIEREAREQEQIRQRELKAARELATERGRRIRVLYHSSIGLGILLLGLTAMALWAVTAERVARRERDVVRRSLYVSDLRLAQKAWEEAQINRLDELLEGQRPERTGDLDLRGFEWYYLKRRSRASHSSFSGTARVAFDPNGKQVAALFENTAKVWEVDTAREVLTLKGHLLATTCIAWSPDGKNLATASEDQKIKIWDATSGLEIHTLEGHFDSVQGVAFSPDGRRLATASLDRTVRIWDVGEGTERMKLKGQGNRFGSVAFSPDGQLLAASGWGNDVLVWESATGRLAHTLTGHASGVSSLSFNTEGDLLATGGMDRSVRIWDVAKGKQVGLLMGHSGLVLAVAFRPKDSLVVSASEDRTVRGWGPSGELFSLRGHRGPVAGVAFSHDGRRLATAGTEVLVWDLDTAQDSLSYNDQNEEMTAVAFDPRGAGFVTASGSLFKPEGAGEAVFRDPTGRKVRSMTGHTGAVAAVAVSPDGNRIASGSFDTTVKIWDSATGRELFTLRGHKLPVTTVAFSNNGRFIASGSGMVGTPLSLDTPGEIKLWDLEARKEVKEFEGHTGRVTCVRFHPDGARLFSASHDGTVRVWGALGGDGGQVFKKYDSPLTSLAFSPDGAWLAVGGLASGASNVTVSIWDVVSGREAIALKGYPGYVHALDFSPDGKRIACGLHDESVKLWELTTGQEVLTLKGHKNRVVGIAFSPMGNRLVSVAADRTVRLWIADN